MYYLGDEVSNQRYVRITALPALFDVFNNWNDVATGKKVDHPIEEHFSHLELNEDFQLILSRFKKSNEKIQNVGMKERVNGCYLV